MSNEEKVALIIKAIMALDQPDDANDRARLRSRLLILLALS